MKLGLAAAMRWMSKAFGLLELKGLLEFIGSIEFLEFFALINFRLCQHLNTAVFYFSGIVSHFTANAMLS